MRTKSLLYGFLAEFNSPEALAACVRSARTEGFRDVDAYTPFPVEGLSEHLAIRRSPIPLIVLIGGIAGLLTGAFLQYYSAVFDYPLNIGGRPLNSWPAFVVVTFELTILFAGLAAVFGMLAVNGLPNPHHPLFNVARFERASQDGFFFCIQATDPQFDRERTWAFLETFQPEGIYVVQDLA
jgi:hypothetical protein